MTLCIAAHAWNHRDIRDQIIICSDALIGDDASTTETASKCAFIAEGIFCLYAGSLDQFEDAVATYRDRLKQTPLNPTHYKEQLHVGYSEFREKIGRRGIKRPNLELVVAGYIQDDPLFKPFVCYVGSTGVKPHPSFVAIGSGSYVADAILRLRQTHARTETAEMLYYVYEAKRLGEASPSVGKEITNIAVLEHFYSQKLKKFIFEFKGLNLGGISYLEEEFKKFGPQKYAGSRESFPWNALHRPSCPM